MYTPAPQSIGYLPGVGSARMNAMAITSQRSNSLNTLQKGSGKRKGKGKGKTRKGKTRKGKTKGKTRKYKGGAVVALPAGTSLMPAVAGGQSTTINQLTNNAARMNQTGANSAFDKNVQLATIPKGSTGGGKRKSRK